jgi:hypothetical protein
MAGEVVLGEKFVWAHMPKTAGDATAAMLAAVPGLVRFADPPDSNDKHMPFFGREDELAGKLLVMNIRRLPAWLLSGAHHKADHGVYPQYRPLPLAAADQLACSTDADDLLRWMTDRGRIRVGRWLRAESLESDVTALLAELGERSDEVERRVRAVGRVNVGDYDRDLDGRFTRAQVERMYECNPWWAELELAAYGDLYRHGAAAASGG